jgi:hypothetical protein
MHIAIFDPKTNAFEKAREDSKNHFSGSTVTQLSDGDVLVTGGGAAVAQHGAAFLWNADPMKMLPDVTGLGGARSFHSALRLPDGKVLFAGGLSRGASVAGDDRVETYDPTTRTFTYGQQLRPHGRGVTLTLLPDGRVVALGTRNFQNAGAILAGGTWSEIAVPQGIGLGTATALPSGKLLIISSGGAVLYSP